MAHEHEHRDFTCRDCGALITCLSCLEIRAAQLPRGPAFTAGRYAIQPRANSPVFETIGVTNEFEIAEPDTDELNQQPLPITVLETQQSLFV